MRYALTSTRLRELLRYDPDTGAFTWLADRGKARTGDMAGSGDGQGYIVIGIDGCKYLAHRLAWFYVKGNWPEHQIDHVNGSRSDNRFANLRDATPAENQQNQRRAHSSNRRSGLLGVAWDSSHGRWKAAISVDGRIRNLGRFDEPEEAHATYLAAKARLHPYQTISKVETE